MSHFPLPDSLHTFFSLCLFAALSRWLIHPSRWLLVLIGIATFLVMTTRETGVIVILSAAAMLLAEWRLVRRGGLAPVWSMLIACVITVVLTTLLAGGPMPLLLMARDCVYAALFTSGALAYAGGPYYRYISDLMLISPALVLTVSAGMVTLLRNDRLRDTAILIAVPQLVFLGLFSLVSKSLRYVLLADIGLRVLAAMIVWLVWQRRPLWGILLLLTMIGHDQGVFSMLWAKDQVYDPVTWSLVKGLRMIP